MRPPVLSAFLLAQKCGARKGRKRHAVSRDPPQLDKSPNWRHDL